MSTVVSVSRSAGHTFSKSSCEEIRVSAGLGVEGDAHAGVTVKHRSRVRRDPAQPNLRQVHLMHAELLDEIGVLPGELGENVTTRGVDLLALSTGTRLHLGAEVVVELTGLRNPCVQIEAHRDGLLAKVVGRDDAGEIVRRAGVMSVVLQGGTVRPGDSVRVVAPAAFVPLQCV
jgi:MOSC domain-containing protein YiiM